VTKTLLARPLPATIALLLGALHAYADDSRPTSGPATNTVDKTQYTLCNPTPAVQMRAMDTDRPNITNTPHAIDAGHLQIETGIIDYAYFRVHSPDDNVRNSDVAFGQFNFRLGVLNYLEVNAIIHAYDLVQAHNYGAGTFTRAGSFGDSGFGGKLNLWGDEGGDNIWGTAMAIQPQFKIPTARNHVGNGHLEFEVGAPFLMNLPAAFHLGLQPGVSRERNSDNNGYVTGLPISISVDRVVVGNVDVYFEYACRLTTEKHVETEQTVDVGGTYPLSDNIVLDVGMNLGLNRAANNIEALTGISVRF